MLLFYLFSSYDYPILNSNSVLRALRSQTKPNLSKPSKTSDLDIQTHIQALRTGVFKLHAVTEESVGEKQGRFCCLHQWLQGIQDKHLDLIASKQYGFQSLGELIRNTGTCSHGIYMN